MKNNNNPLFNPSFDRRDEESPNYYNKWQAVDFNTLKGLTITNIEGLEKGSDVALFQLSNGKIARMFHFIDCCEQVEVEDVCGDINDIIGNEVLLAECVTENGTNEDSSETWTFYKLSTIKGSVTIRWYGTSNGYYSEEVSFEIQK